MGERGNREGDASPSTPKCRDEGDAAPSTPKSRDIRRYYCDFCGICRSKRSLIAAHLLSHHKDEMEDKEISDSDERTSLHTCEECGASFRKPAYLKQHMQSHSLERPFACPLDNCHSSYRRKDHLTRHLLQHQGKHFTCPVESCNRKFVFQGNMTRHVKELHDDESPVAASEGQKQHICQEFGCGKAFKYASKLRKHEDSHVKLDSVEAVCLEPGCMKTFSNAKCLKTHLLSCHQYIPCEVCGTKQLKKNIKRHLRTHDEEEVERIKCSYEGCLHKFSNRSNLKQHVKAVHLELRPFKCRVSGCGQKFSYRHVRDNHERSGAHVYIQGDFLESDEQFRSRPRGGCKRKLVTVETLLRKRVVPPGQDSVLDDASKYVSWLLSENQEPVADV
ncbi:transcription factor IIIA-like [Magnolia sinica]|uniref:transcription factor IIIA-like n=1 Tax=Magnolia sinica TaxID=86752 RepID=UPI0026590FF2|nr:transcription factor IIIA-like [Magnolia sinica]